VVAYFFWAKFLTVRILGFDEALTFCTNYDQKSLFALISCETKNLQVISMRICEYTIFWLWKFRLHKFFPPF